MPELKVTSRHLELDAYLYIRQSTPRQVLENTESTQRQYALRDRAIAFGWPRERIHVLDCDLGKSGSRSAGRDGFQKLVGEVALGKAGLVMGLEVSRYFQPHQDRKSTRLNSSHANISYAVFCLKKKKKRVETVDESMVSGLI